MHLMDSPSSASFAEPITMLMACHDKVKRFCQTLSALPTHIAEYGLSKSDKQALAQIYRYFNQAAPLHHQDEDDDFFPLLLQYCPEAAQDVAFLQAQHHQLHEAWQALDKALTPLIGDEAEPLAAQEIDPSRILRFVGLYAQHLSREEPWLVQAENAIPASELAAIGSRMALRRRQA